MAISGALKLNVQLMRGEEAAIDPGKAMVMDAIDRHGSISAAGRALGMSYRRIWLLATALNADWREPVLETSIAAAGDATRALPRSGGRFHAGRRFHVPWIEERQLRELLGLNLLLLTAAIDRVSFRTPVAGVGIDEDGRTAACFRRLHGHLATAN